MANKTGFISSLAFIIGSLIALSHADVFSSSFKMGSLVETRQKVIDDLDAYIRKEENRIRDLKRRLDQYRVEQENSLEDAESYVGNPVNAYILIKRLTFDLDHIKKLSKNTEFTLNLSENETISYPTTEDLSGAARGLMRLQRIYRMPLEDMANGLIHGTIYYSSKMSASDCYHIGVTIFRTKNYFKSLPWHMEALKRFKSPDNNDDSITEIKILEYIGITYFHIGDMKTAMDWTFKILAIDPDNRRAQNNIIIYEDYEFNSNAANSNIAKPKPPSDEYTNTENSLDTDITTDDDEDINDEDTDDEDTNDEDLNTMELPITSDSIDDKNETNQNDSEAIGIDTNEQIENTADKTTVESTVEYTVETKEITKNDSVIKTAKEVSAMFRAKQIDFSKDMAMYEALCRGEYNVAPEMATRLHCRYIRDTPFLKIAPIKAEHWYFDPDVMILHDVISDTEIEYVKQLGANTLARAQVGSTQKNDSVVADYRVSQNTWLADSDSPIVDRISERTQDFTGLNLNWAEELQLANYGVAGHYEPHFDWSGRVAEDYAPVEWERIATVMFYLSDVNQGGATVFPKLGLSVFPKKGSAIFWINLRESGEGDRATRHAACPVLEGSKWVANKWIILKGNEFIRPCNLEHQSGDDLRHLPAAVPKPEVVDPVIVRYKP